MVSLPEPEDVLARFVHARATVDAIDVNPGVAHGLAQAAVAVGDLGFDCGPTRSTGSVWSRAVNSR